MKFIDDAIKGSEETIENSAPKKSNDALDEELIKIIENSRAKIIVVGAGGAGNNTISRLNEIGIEGAKTIAVNTDAQDLFYTTADKKLLLGRQTCGGLGAGGEPTVGEESAEESEEDIRQELDGSDMVFVTCGLGGGTGTGSAPVISKVAKKSGALTVAVATMPFSAEGVKRRENAEIGLAKLQENADTVIVIPNDKLLEVAPNLPLNKAFMASDEILGRIDISNAKGALINISGSSDLTLNEAEKIVQIVGDRLDPEANIIWGAQIDEELHNMIRTTIVVSGVKSQYTIEPKNDEFEEINFDDEFEGTALGQNEDAPADPLDEFLDGIF